MQLNIILYIRLKTMKDYFILFSPLMTYFMEILLSSENALGFSDASTKGRSRKSDTALD